MTLPQLITQRTHWKGFESGNISQRGDNATSVTVFGHDESACLGPEITYATTKYFVFMLLVSSSFTDHCDRETRNVFCSLGRRRLIIFLSGCWRVGKIRMNLLLISRILFALRPDFFLSNLSKRQANKFLKILIKRKFSLGLISAKV